MGPRCAVEGVVDELKLFETPMVKSNNRNINNNSSSSSSSSSILGGVFAPAPARPPPPPPSTAGAAQLPLSSLIGHSSTSNLSGSGHMSRRSSALDLLGPPPPNPPPPPPSYPPPLPPPPFSSSSSHYKPRKPPMPPSADATGWSKNYVFTRHLQIEKLALLFPTNSRMGFFKIFVYILDCLVTKNLKKLRIFS